MAYDRNKMHLDNLSVMPELDFMYKNGDGGLFAESKRHGSPSLLEMRATAGDTDAMWDLAQVYKNGWGVKRDVAIAQKWFKKVEPLLEKLANNGDTQAMLKLEDYFLYGWGGKKDPAKVRKWKVDRLRILKERAEAGDPHAISQLDREFYMN